MADFSRLNGRELDRYWPQVRSWWRCDSRFRGKQPVEEIRHWITLGEAQMWLVIERDPAGLNVDQRLFLRNHPEGWVHAVFITCRLPDRLIVQIAAGLYPGKWGKQAMQRLIEFAAGLPVELYVRFGWKRHFKEPGYKRYHDPGVLCVRPDQPPRKNAKRPAKVA